MALEPKTDRSSLLMASLSWGCSGYHKAKRQEAFLSFFWSLPVLTKPTFNHEGSYRMILLHSYHLPTGPTSKHYTWNKFPASYYLPMGIKLQHEFQGVKEGATLKSKQIPKLGVSFLAMEGILPREGEMGLYILWNLRHFSLLILQFGRLLYFYSQKIKEIV